MDPRLEQLPVNRSQPKAKEILCPFGCGVKNRGVDDRGYCKHLVGFTVDCNVMELRSRWRGREICGAFTEEVRKTDVLVQMPTQTFRVYRRDGAAPLRREPPSHGPDPDMVADENAYAAAMDRIESGKKEDADAE
jgi:hypothetical protein